MSSGLAIASVTAVFKNLLENSFAQNAAVSSFGGVMVSALPLDRVTVGTEERPQLNLFLYQVSQNRNADWISRDRQDQFSRRFKDASSAAPLALNLHFLLTAFGTKDYQTDLLLGFVMQLFHQNPVLTGDTIRSSLKHAVDVNIAGIFAQALATTSPSALAEQLGEIKISPNFLSAEEMSRVWSLIQGPYRASIAYEASMVCIDSSPSLYQTKATINALQPRIEKITATLDTNGRIVAGCTLVVYGKHLKGEVTQVRLNGDEELLNPQIVEDTRLSMKLPLGLNAGVHQVQIVHQSMYQFQPHHDRFSNVAAFVLHPTITAPVELSVSESPRTLTIQINPAVKSDQRVVLLLYSTKDDSEQVYSFTVAPHHSDVSTIQIPILHVPCGTYYVQVQVDGAESLLDLEQAESHSLQVTLP